MCSKRVLLGVLLDYIVHASLRWLLGSGMHALYGHRTLLLAAAEYSFRAVGRISLVNQTKLGRLGLIHAIVPVYQMVGPLGWEYPAQVQFLANPYSGTF